MWNMPEHLKLTYILYLELLFHHHSKKPAKLCLTLQLLYKCVSQIDMFLNKIPSPSTSSPIFCFSLPDKHHTIGFFT